MLQVSMFVSNIKRFIAMTVDPSPLLWLATLYKIEDCLAAKRRRHLSRRVAASLDDAYKGVSQVTQTIVSFSQTFDLFTSLFNLPSELILRNKQPEKRGVIPFKLIRQYDFCWVLNLTSPCNDHLGST